MHDARTITRRYYEPSTRNLRADLDYHVRQDGVVIWSSRLVLMARPVYLDSDVNHVKDPRHCYEEADAWFVHFMAGDMSALAAHTEEMRRFRWIAFQRGLRSGRVRIMETERVVEWLRCTNRCTK